MKRYLIGGLVLILATNALILAKVAYNRAGKPLFTLTMTEREFSPPFNNSFDNENSAVKLRLKYRIKDQHYRYGFNGIKVTAEQLANLGFSTTPGSEDVLGQDRKLFWALELNGDQYRSEIEQTKAEIDSLRQDDENKNELKLAQDELSYLLNQSTRLYYYDIDTDASRLLDRNASKDNIVIIEGVAQSLTSDEDGKYLLYLQHPSVEAIMMPSQFKSAIDDHIEKLHRDEVTGFDVTISWGQAYEPWVESFELRDKTGE